MLPRIALGSSLALAALAPHGEARSQTLGPDGFGYVAESIPLDFVDVSATGTDLGLAGVDDGGALVDLGFSFDFYGEARTQVEVSTNGFLTFDGNAADAINECPYFPFAPSVAIYPYWDDLSLEDHGAVLHQVLGEAPERVAVFQWDDVHLAGDPGSALTFQVRLHEGTNAIELHYANLVDGLGIEAAAAEATVGLENSSFAEGTGGLLMSCNQPFLQSGDAWRIEPHFPFVSGPGVVEEGSALALEGSGAPGHAFCVAFAPDAGPTSIGGPFDLDLGPDLASIAVLGTGVVDAGGAFSASVLVPPAAGLACAPAFFQAYTLGDGVAAKTNVVSPLVLAPEHVQTVAGVVVQAGTGDHFTFEAEAGTLLSARLCPSDASSPLEPELCLFGPDFFAVQGGAGPGCLGEGPPFSASIEGLALPHAGTYTIIATGSALGGSTGGYELTVEGCVPPLFPSFDGGPTCP